MRTPQTLLTPLGTRYPAISIPGNAQARGIVIDNPSGAWLHLRPTDDFVPPYTMGWSRPLPGLTAVDISYESPAGQQQTLQGDIPSVILDTDPVSADSGSSSGTPFVERFTPVQNTAGIIHVPMIFGPGFTTVLVAIPNKRYRILTIETSQFFDSTGAEANAGVNAYIMSIASVMVQWFSGAQQVHRPFLTPYKPFFFASFPLGFDLDVNSPLRVKPEGAILHSLNLAYVVSFQVL